MSVGRMQAAKEKKRQEKEQAKKVRAERERLRTVLVLQHVLTLLEDQSFRTLLLTGGAGLQPVTEERLKKIDQFRESVALDGKISEENFGKQADVVVDRLFNLADGKKRDAVKGLSYADLKEVLLSIHKSGFAAPQADKLTGEKQQAEAGPSAPVVAPPLAPTTAQVPPQSQQVPPQTQPLTQGEAPAVYSFGTVAAVDSRPDQDPAVVSIIPSFAAANGSIPSQIYTNPSYSGVFVPVTGAVVSGGHLMPAAQLIAAPQHFASPPAQSAHLPSDTAAQSFDQPSGDPLLEVSNINLNEDAKHAPENEFRQKDSRRSKFQSQGYRRDDKPARSSDFHGSSNGFQRKQDRYQGNNRGSSTPLVLSPC